MSKWEAVIGLEIHVELNTKSKLFSPAPNHFGDDPNRNIHAVCTGMPGALPTVNKEAVAKVIRFGLAIGASIREKSVFDRKSYFYPDSPRNFQITQFYHPIMVGGHVEAEVDGVLRSFEVEHAHLEDDAGKLMHFPAFAAVDYNRAGVPLLEIVSKPCFHTAKEASAYAQMVRAIMLAVDASEANMEEGQLRMDVNISARPLGEKTLRTKSEIKNINSFSFMEMAIESEFERHVRMYETNQTIPQATYRFDVEKKKAIMMRTKETSDDYRYFPEPDLPPLYVSTAFIEGERKKVPELPLARKKRYIEKLALDKDNAQGLVDDLTLCSYFEQALACVGNDRLAQKVCNWIVVEFAGRGAKMTLPAEHLGALVLMIENGTITGRMAKEVADLMVKEPHRHPKDIVSTNPNFSPVSDVGELQAMIDEVMQEQPQSVADFKSGKDKAFAFLVGQIMKKSRGKASPQVVNDLLRRALSA